MQFFRRRSLLTQIRGTLACILHEKGSTCPSGNYRISGWVKTVSGNLPLLKAPSRSLLVWTGKTCNDRIL